MDGSTDRLCLWHSTGRECTSVYVIGVIKTTEQELLPEAVVSLYDRLNTFTDQNAKSWYPENIEVMMWPYEHSPEEPKPWPARWPDLEAPSTLQRGEDSYSIYVRSTDREELADFLQGLGERQAVLLGGRKWAVDVRFPFPQEAKWMSSD